MANTTEPTIAKRGEVERDSKQSAAKEYASAKVVPIVKLQEADKENEYELFGGKAILNPSGHGMRQNKALNILADHSVIGIPKIAVQEHDGDDKLWVLHAADSAYGEPKKGASEFGFIDPRDELQQSARHAAHQLMLNQQIESARFIADWMHDDETFFGALSRLELEGKRNIPFRNAGRLLGDLRNCPSIGHECREYFIRIYKNPF